MANHPLTIAVREIDGLSDHGKNVGEVCEDIGLKAEDVMYVAEQRALRSVYFFSRGIQLKLTESVEIRLNPIEMKMLLQFESAYMDGLCIGWRARDYVQKEDQAS